MQRRNLLLGAAGAAGAALVPGVVLAQTARVLDPQKTKALMGGDYATATSELAARRSQNKAVRAFAELEIAEQAAVAKAFGSRPGAAGLSPRHAALVRQLSALRGRDFDEMYIDGQIRGHQELLAVHKQYARSGSDPMARGAAMVGVAGIETHLVMLRTIKSMRG